MVLQYPLLIITVIITYFQGFPEIPFEYEILRGVRQGLDHYEADLSVVWIVSIVHTAGQLHG